MVKSERSYANISDPVIAAVAGGLYSFRSENDAIQVLKQIKENNIVSSGWPSTDKDAVFWVRGYDITDKEAKTGSKGNFAQFKVDKASNKKYTIRIEKIPYEVSKHPERKYQKQQHPNWGHPVLRAVKKKKKYPTIDHAEKDLRFLQEEFPLVTIPAAGKVYTMVFEKENNKGSVKKYILVIKENPGDGFFIDYEENKPRERVEVQADKPKQEAVGTFTTKVLLKRANKRKPAKKPSIRPADKA